MLNIIVAILLLACKSSDGTEEPIEVRLPSLVRTQSFYLSSEPMPKGDYSFGLFFMKTNPGSEYFQYIPSNSYYYNVNDIVSIGNNGNVTRETHHTSTDTITIDSLMIDGHSYCFSYYPFRATADEPSEVINAYYGSRIPFKVTGATDLLVTENPTEIRADLVSDKVFDISLNMKHALTQYIFYVANNSESDTIEVSSVRVLGLNRTKLLYSSLYLNAFTSTTMIDSSIVTTEFNVQIEPALRLLPGEVANQPVSMMFPSMNIDESAYGKVCLTMNAKVNNTYGLGYADTIPMLINNYEQDKAYAMIVGVKSDGGVGFTSQWGITNWGAVEGGQDNVGIHYSANACISIVPWKNLSFISDDVPGGNANVMGYVNAAEWSIEDFSNIDPRLRRSSDHTMHFQNWSTVTENIVVKRFDNDAAYGIDNWGRETVDETIGK